MCSLFYCLKYCCICDEDKCEGNEVEVNKDCYGVFLISRCIFWKLKRKVNSRVIIEVEIFVFIIKVIYFGDRNYRYDYVKYLYIYVGKEGGFVSKVFKFEWEDDVY